MNDTMIDYATILVRLRAGGGVGTVTGCIQTLRRNIVTRLRKAGITAGRADVIDHDEQGYFLRDWIVVRDGDNSECPCDVPADVPANVSAGAELNPRRLWILDQLRQGVAIQRVTVEEEFDVGEKTAKRDLSELVRSGLIAFQRSGRPGFYRQTLQWSSSPDGWAVMRYRIGPARISPRRGQIGGDFEWFTKIHRSRN